MKTLKKKMVAIAVGVSMLGTPVVANAYGDASQIMQIWNYVLDQLKEQAENKVRQLANKVNIPGFGSDILGEIYKQSGLDPVLGETSRENRKFLLECQQAGMREAEAKTTDVFSACLDQLKLRTQQQDRQGVGVVNQSSANAAATRKASGEVAVNIYNEASAQGAGLLSPQGTELLEKRFVDAVHAGAGVTADKLVSSADDRMLLSNYLTMFPIVPVGNYLAEEDSSKSSGWFSNSQTQRELITTALVGIREVSVSNQKTLNEGGYFLQAEKYKKYARMQFARMTILGSLNPGVIKTMRQMYQDYVMTPTDEQLGGYDANGNYVKGNHYSTEQLLQLLLRQSQAQNWNLLEIRRLQMEQIRIGGVMTAILEDGGSSVGGIGGGIGSGGSGRGSTERPNAAPVETFLGN